MFRKKVFLLILFVYPLITFGQNSAFPDDETSIRLKNEAVGGVLVHQNGWGGFFRKGKHMTAYKKKMYDLEVVTYKHPKEYSIINPSYESASSFVYGKLNSLLILRTGIGIQKVLYSKADRAGVEVKYSYYGGVSWGIVKPVYLDILHASSEPYEYEINPEKYNEVRHSSIDSIYGKSSFGYGLTDLKLYPGVYGKFGLNFEYGTYNETVKAIEAGIIIDAYPKAIPIMAFIPNNNIYFSFYISFMYGGRW